MPFPRATLTQRRDEVLQDIGASRIVDVTTGSVVDATMLQTSPLRTMGYGMAAAAYEEDGYIDWLALQSNPWTATGEWAEAWGALVGIIRKPAVSATGSVPVTVTGPSQVTIPAGTQFGRTDGALYSVSADTLVASGATGSVNLVAVVPGSAGNAAAGTQLVPTLTLAGASAQPIAVAMAGGSDPETDAALRSRYLLRWRSTPQGGAVGDYVAWALAVPGVTRAWALPLGMGPGTVTIYTMWDGGAGAFGLPVGTNGVAAAEPRDTAATGNQLTVANALYSLRPATALLYSCAPAVLGFDFTVTTLGAVSASMQAAAAAAVQSMFVALADPLGGKLLVEVFGDAIEGVAGMPSFTLVSSGGPVLQAPVGQLPALAAGGITWVVAN